MDDRDWKIIKVLFQEKNITKTAEILFISQPTLTKRLQQIEDEWGVQIVQRGRRGVQFTPQGEYLNKCAEEMLVKLREMKDHISDMDDEASGTLRLGVSHYFTRYKLSGILRLFKQQYPNVEFDVTSGLGHEIYDLAFRQEFHVAFIRGDYNWEDFKHLLLEETICIASLYPIELKDLPKQPRINYQSDYKLKDLIHNWWTENYKVPPRIAMEVDRTVTCKEMVMNGLGYGIIPSSIVDDVKGIYKIDITDRDGKPIKRKTWMLYNEEFTRLKLVRTFVEFVKDLDLQAI